MAFVFENYGFKFSTYFCIFCQFIYLFMILSGHYSLYIYQFYVIINRPTYAMTDILIDYFSFNYFDKEKAMKINAKIYFVICLSSLFEILSNFYVFDPKNPLRIYTYFTILFVIYNTYYIYSTLKLKIQQPIKNN